MSRLEKKCFVASAGAHAFLALLLCLAPLLWVSQRPEIMRPALIAIPSRLIDGVMSGGGSPHVTAPPAPAAAAEKPVLAPPAAPVAVPKPRPAQPKPEAKPVRQEVEAPPKLRSHKTSDTGIPEKKMARAEESDDSGKASKKKTEISLSRETGAAKSKQKSAAESRAEAAAAAAALQAQFADKVKGVLGAIGERTSTGTSIEVPGPGGEAYASYGQFVQFFYKNAWSPPTDAADDGTSVRARVVIRRDGTVESFVLVDHSGKAIVDNSVERLKHLKSIGHPFPEGAKEDRRSFLITFNLRPDKY